MKKISIVFILVLVSMKLFAQLDSPTKSELTYKSTDNEGMSKQERLDHTDDYLKTISNSIKVIESKLEKNTAKIKNFEETIQDLKSEITKLKSQTKPEISIANKKELKKEINKEFNKDSEKIKSNIEVDEITKIKQEIEILKTKDINKLRSQINNLSDTLEAVQATLRAKN